MNKVFSKVIKNLTIHTVTLNIPTFLKQKLIATLKIVLILFTILGLAACAKKDRGDVDEMVGVGDNMSFYGTDLSPEEERALLNRNTYYFAYDSYDLSDQDVMSVYAHAKKIMTHRKARVRVEGHTDERGSREYNVALGERRAKAVANLLMIKGVNPNQISVVSYGKEKPIVSGQTESAWSQNRRAVIVYEVE